MCVRGRQLPIRVLLLWFGFAQGTYLASAATPLEKSVEEACTAWPISGTEKETLDCNSKAGESSRIYLTSCYSSNGSHSRMELPVHFNRSKEWPEQSLLQQLRLPLGDGEMVASYHRTDPLTKPTQREEREGQEEDSTTGNWKGRESDHRHPGAIWDRRPTGIRTLGGHDTNQDGECITTSNTDGERERNNNDSSSRGEDRGERQAGAVEEDTRSQRCGGQGDLRADTSSRNSIFQRRCATVYHSQDPESTPESRKAVLNSYCPAEGTGCTMGEMEQVYEGQDSGAERPLQGEEEGNGQPTRRIETTFGCIENRNATSCATESREQGGRLCGPTSGRLRHGTRDDPEQRRRGQEEAGGDYDGSELPSQSPEEGVMMRRVSIQEEVKVHFYTDDFHDNCYEFSTSLDRLESWDSKPWALYRGNFVRAAQELFGKVCLHRTAGSSEAHEGDQLCHGRAGDDLHGDDQDRALRHDHGHQERQELQEEAESAETYRLATQQADESQKPGVLHLFGMNGGFLEQRQVYQDQHDFEDSAIWDAIESRWGDHMGEGTTYYVPQPQPSQDEDLVAMHLYILVDFLPLWNPLHFGKVAVLCDIKGWTDQFEVRSGRSEGAMVNERTTWIELVQALALEEQCRHRVGNQCIIRMGWTLMLSDDIYTTQDNSLISINYNHEDDMPERVSLLQVAFQKVTVAGGDDDPRFGSTRSTATGQLPTPNRHDSSGREDLQEAFRQVQQVRHRGDIDTLLDDEGQFAHLFHRTRDYTHARLTATDPFEERRQIARIWGVQEQEIMALHPVPFPPDDLQGRVLINRWAQDANYKSFDSDVLVLFDLELHSGDNQRPNIKLFRHVDWTRASLTREGVLQSTYVEGYCRIIARDACLVWHNRQLWPVQDLAARDLRAGDSIRVAVPAMPDRSAEDLRQTLHRVEQNARDHVHFGPHTDSTSEEHEEEESEHTRYGRSSTASEPEPHDHWIDPDIADQCQRLLAAHRGSGIVIEVFILHGPCSHGMTFEAELPFSWKQIRAQLQQQFGNILQYHIAIHPVLEGMERRAGRCRVVVELSHASVRPLRTHNIPVLVCYPLPVDCWEAVYSPKDWQLFEKWMRDRRLSCADPTTSMSSPGMLLICQGDSNEDQTGYAKHLQDVHGALVQVYSYAVNEDGTSAGWRTDNYPRWQIAGHEQLHDICKQMWPQLQHTRIILPTSSTSNGNNNVLHVIVCPRSCQASRVIRCSVSFVKEDEKVAIIYTAVGLTNTDAIDELYGKIGLQNAPTNGIDCDASLPILRDGDHLGLTLTLLPGRQAREQVRYPTTSPDKLEDKGHEIDFIYHPRAEKIRLANSLDGSLYQPPLPETTRQGNAADHIDFKEVFALLEWIDASLPEVQWSLPEGVQWHEQSLPWTTTMWWDLAYADEISIYTDGSATKISSSAAAVIFARVGSRWYFAGYLKQDLISKPCAHRAELCGLLLAYHYVNATLRRLAFFQQDPPKINILFDATSAGYKAAGVWKGKTYHHLTEALRSLEHMFEARFNITIAFHHVLGHDGDPGNEAANTIANYRSERQQFDTSVWCKAFNVHAPRELQWLWALWKPEWQGLWNEAGLHYPKEPTTRASPEVFGSQVSDCASGQKETPSRYCGFKLCIASANVLSLLPHGGHLGLQGGARMEMLQTQLHDKGYHLIGIQETRFRSETQKEQNGFLIFGAPATSRGHYGCQIWISTSLPVGQQGDRFCRQHCKIIAKNPRWLIIQIKAPFMKAIVITAHAPTSQTTAEEIAKWWENLSQQIPLRPRNWPQILLADANARVGSQPSEAIGTHHADDQDAGGEEFHGYLLAHRLWLPATFHDHHEGDSGTWKHPRTGSWSRGDYIGIPSSWSLQTCHSYVDHTVDLALTREDHRLVAACVTWQAIQSQEPIQRKMTAYDVGSLRRDLGGPEQAALRESLQCAVPMAPHYLDVHTHTRILQTSLQKWMDNRYAKRKKQPRRPHMSPETWQLVLSKQKLRQELFRQLHRRQAHLLAWCFHCWSGKNPGDLYENMETARRVAQTVQQFQALGRAVTKALRQDDRQYFKDMADSLGDQDVPGNCNRLWKSIRWMLPKMKGRRGVSPLLVEALDSQSLPHFGKLEAGEITTPMELVELCCGQHRADAAYATQLPELNDLPTRYEIEQILLGLQSNKAPGPDRLPGELFKGAAAPLAAHVHDLLCKTICWNTEAVQHKGGFLHPIHKKGSQDDVANYRGVMILNVASKVLHSWIRSRLVVHLESVRPDTQLGGFKNQQVTYGSHCVQLVAKLAHHHQVPMGCVFFDVQGAFHFLIRELVMGEGPKEDAMQLRPAKPPRMGHRLQRRANVDEITGGIGTARMEKQLPKCPIGWDKLGALTIR